MSDNQKLRDRLAKEYVAGGYGCDGDTSKDSFIRGWDTCRAHPDEKTLALVQALKSICGDRCAHQNPCEAREALKSWGIE